MDTISTLVAKTAAEVGVIIGARDPVAKAGYDPANPPRDAGGQVIELGAIVQLQDGTQALVVGASGTKLQLQDAAGKKGSAAPTDVQRLGGPNDPAAADFESSKPLDSASKKLLEAAKAYAASDADVVSVDAVTAGDGTATPEDRAAVADLLTRLAYNVKPKATAAGELAQRLGADSQPVSPDQPVQPDPGAAPDATQA